MKTQLVQVEYESVYDSKRGVLDCSNSEQRSILKKRYQLVNQMLNRKGYQVEWENNEQVTSV